MVKVIVGMMGSSVASGSTSMSTAPQIQSFLSVLTQHKIQELDTARVYNGGKSESLLGEVHASETFSLATKAPAFSPGSLAYEKIVKNCELSLQALGVQKVPLYYLHGPDSQTPLEEQCRAMNDLHSEGKFDRWGVCNIPDSAVREVLDICKRNGWVAPSVYQGGFSPLHRKAADTLIPLLRENGMVFYAFSPLAGGLLAKPLEKILKPAKGSRFDAMPVFGDLFLNETIVEALKRFTGVCDGAGVGVMEATLRWFKHHSPLGEGDGFILGASTVEQIEASLSASEKGPLEEDVVKGFEVLWDAIKDKAPGYA